MPNTTTNIAWLLRTKDGQWLMKYGGRDTIPYYPSTIDISQAVRFYDKPSAEEVARNYSGQYQPKYPELVRVKVTTIIEEIATRMPEWIGNPNK